MLHFTPQERLALGVTALLLAAGAGVRVFASPAEPAAWVDSRGSGADTLIQDGSRPPRAEAERSRERERRRASPLADGERIDPNAAAADELERLPRVGPALAARIVAHRQEHGKFRSLADFDAVPGVGPAMLERLAPHLTLKPGGGGAGGGGGESRLALNRTTAAELEALPGIGRVLAERIVAHREAHGAFRSVDELEKVPGMGPALRARIAPMLRL